MEKIHEFISDLLVRRGITDLPDDIREQTIDEMTDLLLDEIDNAAIDALPEDKAIELANGLENGSIKQEDVANFMKAAGLDLEQISFDTMQEFGALYLGDKIAPKVGDDFDEEEEEK